MKKIDIIGILTLLMLAYVVTSPLLLREFHPTYNEITSFKQKELLRQDYDTLLVNITVYNPVPSQTQGNPLETADGSIIDLKMLSKGELRWCALSRNLLTRWGGNINYGDSIYIMSLNRDIRGWWIVKDTMHSRYNNYVDLLVPENTIFGKWQKQVLIKK